MLKLCMAALLASLCCIGAASAHSGGGGGFEPIPRTSYADLPPYWPQRIVVPVRPFNARHLRWQRQGFAHGR
jgi:hypothetical protein